MKYLKVLFVFLGVATSNFLYQYFMLEADYMIAFERSYFAGMMILVLSLFGLLKANNN